MRRSTDNLLSGTDVLLRARCGLRSFVAKVKQITERPIEVR
jgi:hypothetical protein